jgi:hypothetical protein
MKSPLCRLACGLSLIFTFSIRAATYYVDSNGSNPTPPYSDWSTAATNIQDAIDASSNGDMIWVTNGVYQNGGRVMAGTLTNRVALTKAVTVQSVNGPFVTTILGAGPTNGNSAVRCAWLTNNATLAGFTLQWGATLTSGDTFSLQSGGGAWCASSNAFIANCVIVSNRASSLGGGVYQGTLNSCAVIRNGSAIISGGAVNSAILNNCTVVSNSLAGTSGGRITNSIVYYNSFGNYTGGSFSYCCVAPEASGPGNFTNAPQLLPDNLHLSSTSPCIGAGTAPVTIADIFGNSWGSPPSVGCVEAASRPVVTQPQIQVTGAPVGFTVGNLTLSGQGPFAFHWLKDGVLLQDDGHFSGTQSNNLVAIGATLADAGQYQLVVSNSFGATTSAVARVIVHCVSATSTSPTQPYTNWTSAAVQIQDALDSSGPGDIILVTNGIYNTGGHVMSGNLTNRVALTNPVAVIGINGYTSTAIEGQQDPISKNGPAAVRCAWLANGAVLSGFTLRNGATPGNTGIMLDQQYGGGAWLSSNAVVCNCVFTNNSAYYGGGGVAFGTVNNCFLTQNTALYGGGGYSSAFNNCTFIENHCTANSGAGAASAVGQNCILLNNYYSAFGFPDYSEADLDSFSHFSYSCATPKPSGAGNISTKPSFIDAAFHLAAVSPCRGAGNPGSATGTDLDDEPWSNPPSMGCDEIVDANLAGPLSVNIQAWITEYPVNHYLGFNGFATGRVSRIDWSFGDGGILTNANFYSNHAWTNAGAYPVAFTAYNADNPAGVSTNILVTIDPLYSPSLGTASIQSNSFQFTFSAQTYANYTIQYATNLASPINWQTLRTIFYSTGGLTTIQDPVGTNTSRFYRIQVQ